MGKKMHRWSGLRNLVLRSLLLPFLSIAATALGQEKNAIVNHAPSVNGTIQGSVQMNLGEWMNLNSGMVITEDLLVPGSPSLNFNAQPTGYQGTVTGSGSSTPSNYGITVNGGVTLRHIVTRTNPVTIPSVGAPANPAGTRYVTINSAGQSMGDPATLRDLTLNSNVGNYTIPGGNYGRFTANSGTSFTLGVAGETTTYSFQDLTLNSGGNLHLLGPVVITLSGNLSVNAQCVMGKVENPEWLALRFSGSSNPTINSGGAVHGSILAPSAHVYVNGKLRGTVQSDRLTVNSGGIIEKAVAPNAAPVVNAGADQSIRLPATAALNGSATDDGKPVGASLSYNWIKVSGPGAVTFANAAAAQTTATFVEPGIYVLRLTVSDSALSGVDELSVAVLPANMAPVVEAGSDALIHGPGNVSLAGSATDDGVPSATLTYGWSQVSGPGSAGFTDASALQTSVSLPATGAYVLRLTVSDGELSASDEMNVVVNALPVVTISQPEEGGVYVEGTQLAVTTEATDDDGVAKVEVFTGKVGETRVKIGEVTAAPYTLAWTAAETGHWQIEVRVTDSRGGFTVSGLRNILVEPANEPPVANDQAIEVDEDGTVSFTLAASDPNGDGLVYEILAAPAHGILSGTEPNLVYTPQPNSNAGDSFTYRAIDPAGLSDTATVSITVRAVNDAPLANAQAVSTDEDTALAVTLTGSDIEGDALTYRITREPEHGALSGTAPNLSYQPAANYHGGDSFEFVANDGTVDSAAASVAITIDPINDAPVAQGRELNGTEDEALDVVLSGTDADGDSLSFVITTQPSHGTLSGTGANMRYTPEANYHGEDSFGFIANDGTVDSSSATVTIHLASVNDAPTVALSSPASGTLVDVGDAVSVTATAADIDGTIAKVEFYAGETKIGEATAEPWNIAWQALAGTHSLKAIATDNENATAEAAAVTLYVNTAPAVDAGEAQLIQEGATATLSGTATDDGLPQGVSLEYAWAKASGPGTVSFAESTAANTTATFSAPGTYVLRLTVSDSRLSGADEVTVVVNGAPVLGSNSFNVNEDETLNLALAATDPENEALTFAILTQPQHGALTGNAPNLIYSPASNFHGSDSFTFRVTDSHGSSVEGTATITIVSVNDAPVVSVSVDAEEIELSEYVILTGSATDDDSAETLGYEWSKVSGPGRVMMLSATSKSTLAMFETPGTYVLRLTAGDGELYGSDDVTVNVILGNQPPVVSAGPDRTATVGESVALDGSVNDDGLPSPSNLQISWRVVSGSAAAAVINTPNSAQTNVTFAEPGDYILRLSATDGALSGSDQITVRVSAANTAPSVQAGADQTAELDENGEAVFTLNGSASDDGKPGPLTIGWSIEGSPASAQLSETDQLTTQVRITASGSYTLRLTANDGVLNAEDELTIIVTERLNRPPAVNAGADQKVEVFGTTKLSGTVADDGLPQGGTVSVRWTQISGPAEAVLASPQAAVTEVQIQTGGLYQFQLSGNDGELTAMDMVSVEAVIENQAPAVSAGENQSVPTKLATLAGAATDDGLPGPLTLLWEFVSGPGTATFANAGSGTTTVRVTENGSYVFRLTATDGALEDTDEVQVAFGSSNQAPEVNAGSDLEMSHYFNAGQNLVQNPGAELSGTLPGWQQTSGSTWARATASPGPKSGTAYFAAGSASTGELRQDVDVSALAQNIDNKQGIFEFSAFYRCKNEARLDWPSVVVEYRSADATLLKSSEILLTPLASAWGVLADSKVAPVGTRTVRIRLLAESRLSDAATDVYFDDVSLRFADLSATELQGTITDDGKPAPANLVSTWTQIAGPAVALLSDPHAAITRVYLPSPGSYRFKLTADDSELSAEDEAIVEVTAGSATGTPVAHAGADIELELPEAEVTLSGVVSDPDTPLSQLTYTWAETNTGVRVYIENPASASTRVRFYEAGEYKLRLSVSDGQSTAYDEVNVKVNCSTQTPNLDVALVIDKSGLMSGVPLEDAKNAASAFLERLSAEDRAAIVSFAGEGTLDQPLTHDKEAARQKVWQITVSLYTDVARGIEKAKDELIAQSRPGAIPVIILLSDGGSDHQSAFTVANAARAAGIRVLSIGFSAAVDNALMAGVADSPAEYFFAPDSKSFDTIYDTLSKAFCRSGYQISVYPGPSLQLAQQAGMLQGRVEYLNLPAGYETGSEWSFVSGPGTVECADATSPVTAATFSAPGAYVLKLTGRAGRNSVFDSKSATVTVQVGLECATSSPDGLVAFWKGEGNAVDAAGSFDGENDIARNYVAGKVGQGFSFPVDTKIIRFPTSGNLNVGSGPGFSVEFWTKPMGGAPQSIFGWYNAQGQRQFAVETVNEVYRQLNLICRGASGTEQVITTLYPTVVFGEWVHLGFAYTAASGELRMYKNGALFQIFYVTAGAIPTVGDIFIGGNAANAQRYTGLLDEISIYNRPLGPSEMWMIYNTGELGKCPPSPNQAPYANAGQDQVSSDLTVAVEGFASDDGSPEGSTLVTQWRKVSGPGTVMFGDSATTATSATFSTAGLYVLELSATDGIKRSTDTINIRCGMQCLTGEIASLRAWWPGNGTTQEIVSGYHGEVVGSVGYTTGRVGDAFSFTATGAVAAQTGGGLNVGMGEAFSVEFWYYHGAGGEAPVFGWYNALGQRQFAIDIGSAFFRQFRVTRRDAAGQEQSTMTPYPTYNTGQWVHLVFTYTTATGDLLLYRNGVQYYTANLGAGMIPMDGAIYIGSNRNNSLRLHGLVDEISVYDRALGVSEITSIYNAGASGKCPSQANRAPVVFAGNDLTLASQTSATLSAHVSDDGLPQAQTTGVWSLVSGPVAVSFSTPESANTDVAFAQAGTYQLQYTASDGQLSGTDTLQIVVLPAAFNQAPSVSAGEDRTVGTAEIFSLQGTVTDDGLPSGNLSSQWTVLDGPGEVIFADSGSPTTETQIELPGVYNLSLTAHDGDKTASDTVTITVVEAGNQPPLVNAGSDQSVSVGQSVALLAQVEDDGLPNGVLTLQWTKASGSTDGSKLFVDGNGVLNAQFVRAGDYVFTLSASDGEFTVTDDVAVHVEAPSGSAPAVAIVYPSTGFELPRNRPATIRAEASDADGIERVEFYANGSWIGEANASPYEVAWLPASAGTVELTATAVDGIGAVAVSGPVSIIVVDLAPTVTLTAPADGSVVQPGTQVRASATTGGSAAVARVEFYVDDVLIGQDTVAPYGATWTASTAGSHSFQAKVVDVENRTALSNVNSVTVLAELPEAPVIEILTPDSQVIRAPFAILGTVESDILKNWRVEFRETGVSCSNWTVFGSGTGEVTNEALGTFDPTNLKNGIYEIRIVAGDLAGRTVTGAATPVIVDGNMKFGYYTVSFQDLTLPSGPLPIGVTRTYDSREKCEGDFGPGWQLGLSNVRLTASYPMGEQWENTIQWPPGCEDCAIGNCPEDIVCIPEYCIKDNGRHVIAIRFPNGDIQRFRPVIKSKPDLASACRLAAPWRFFNEFALTFEPMPGSQGQLTATGIPSSLHLSDDQLGGIVWLDRSAEFGFDAQIFRDPTGWEYTTLDGQKLTFDAKGELLRITDRSGQFVTFAETGIYDSAGRSVTWTRDAVNGGRITEITDPAGKKLLYGYSPAGDLVSVTDRDGYTTTFTYDANHNLEKVIDPRGIAGVTNRYDAAGKLYESVDAAGIVTRYDNDPADFAQSFTRNGRTGSTKYDEQGNLIEKIDPSGLKHTYAYHQLSDGAVTKLKTTETLWARLADGDGNYDPAGAVTALVTSYAYEDDNAGTPARDDGLLRKVIDPSGRTLLLTYEGDAGAPDPGSGRAAVPGQVKFLVDAREAAAAQAEGRAPNPAMTFGYYDVPTSPLFGHPRSITDAAGNEIVVTYWGSVNSPSFGKPKTLERQVTSYDAAGNPTVETLRISYEYDELGNLASLTDPEGRVTYYTYDFVGNPQSASRQRTVYDASGAAAGTEWVTTGYAYDNSGRLTKQWNPDRPRTGATDTWTDGDGQGPSLENVYGPIGKPEKVYDAGGRLTTYAYDERGSVVLVVYPDGRREEFRYDAEGRKEYRRGPDGNWTRYVYDARGKLSKELFLGASQGGAGQLVSEKIYDEAGRLWRKVDGDGVAQTFGYDLSGRPVKAINGAGETASFAWDANGNLTHVAQNGRVKEHRYDALNRRVQSIFPASEITENGTTRSVSTELFVQFDELGRRVAEYELSPVDAPLAQRSAKRYAYDLTSRLLSVTDAAGQATAWGYDETGNRISQTDAEGRTTRYQYDSAGKRTARRLPLGDTETIVYDAAGQTQQITSFEGKITTLAHDAAGRVTSRTVNGETVTYTYNPVTGVRETMTDGTGTTTFVHDSRGRLTEKRTPLGPGVTLTYDWTLGGRLAAIRSSTAEGVDLGYQYNSAGRLDLVTDSGSTLVEYDYDVFGNLSLETAVNGLQHDYAYDALNRVNGVSLTGGGTTPALLASYQYDLNARGQRVAVQEAEGRQVEYQFDAMRRLTAEVVTGDARFTEFSTNGSVNYSYDDVGNRLSRNVSGAIASLVPAVPSYTYNANDELETISASTSAVTTTATPDGLVKVRLVYDGDGHLVRKVVGEGTAAVTIDYLVAEHNPTGYSQVVEEYRNAELECVYGVGHKLINQSRLSVDRTQFETRFYGRDGSGSVRSLSDAAGNLTDEFDYDAFGNQIGRYVLGDGEPVVNEVGFAGERYDAHARLYNLRARFYDPSTGRMEGRDPFEGYLNQPASLHPYVYAQNDPVNLGDPSGAIPTLLGALMMLEGKDPLQNAYNEVLVDAQLSTLGATRRSVRTVADYLYRLLHSNDGEFAIEGEEEFQEEKTLDLLIPPNLLETLVQNARTDTHLQSIWEDVLQVANLADGGGITFRGILQGLGRAEGAFLDTYRTAQPGDTYASGISHTATHANEPIRVTEYYSPYRYRTEVHKSWHIQPARMLRLGLDGRPIADPVAGETDLEPMETFVHAGELRLYHETADIFVPLSGGQLALQVRRNLQPENWDTAGWSPDQYPDRPFGPGWKSNLISVIEFVRAQAVVSTAPIEESYAIVHDENGLEHRFVITHTEDAQGNDVEVFQPLPSSRNSNEEFMNSLRKQGLDYVFTRKYGTKLTYSMAGGAQQRGDKQVSYARLTSVKDRFDNELTYFYGPGHLPTEIRATSGGTSRSLIITDTDADDQPEQIQDPRGKIYTYEYTPITFQFHGSEHTVKALTKVTDPEGAFTGYGYDLHLSEAAQYKLAIGWDPSPVIDYYHLDLSQFVDPNGNQYLFAYGFDYTLQRFYTGPAVTGLWPAKGQNRILRQVTLPSIPTEGGGSTVPVARFAKEGEINPQGTNIPGLPSWQTTHVEDAAGNRLQYDFKQPHAAVLESKSAYFKPEAIANEVIVPNLSTFNTAEITYFDGGAQIGKEVVQYDFDSGMQVKETADLCGNTASFTYGNAWDFTRYYPGLGDLDLKLAWGKHGDATRIERRDKLTGKTLATQIRYADRPIYGISTPGLHVLDQVLDAEGRQTTFTLDGIGRTTREQCIDEVGAALSDVELTYAGGFKAFATGVRIEGGAGGVPDVVEERTADPLTGRLASSIVAPGDLSITSSYTYDANGNLLTARDPNTNVTSYVRDGRNLLKEIHYADGTAGYLGRDGAGNVTGVEDGNGVVTTFEYDALHRQIAAHRAMGNNTKISTSVLYDALGSAVLATDAKGKQTKMEYDALQRLKKVTGPAPFGYTTEYKYEFTKNGLFRPTEITDARGFKTTLTYDGFYRAREQRRQYEAGKQSVQTFEYDDAGNVRFARQKLTGGAAAELVTEILYDGLNRPITIKNPDGTSSEIGYTGFGKVRQTKDELGRVVTISEFDAAGRAKRTLYPAVAGGQPETRVEYDAAGNVVAVIDARNNRTDFEYNERNWQVKATGPAVFDADTGAMKRPEVITTYDNAGNVVKVRDPRGKETETIYDNAYRPVEVISPDVEVVEEDGSSSVSATSVSTQYDANGNPVMVTDASGRVTKNEFDSLDRLVKSTNAAGISTLYGYDAAGNLTSVTDGKSQTTTMEYDGLNRQRVQRDPAGRATTWEFNELNVIGQTDAKGQSIGFSYNLRNRLEKMMFAGREQDNRTYSYDAAGNLLSVTQSGGLANVAYTYDALNRVITESSNGATHTYRYDLNGNRISVDYGGSDLLITSTYDALNRLTSMLENERITSYSYDLNGNNRFKTLGNGEQIENRFDALNRRKQIIGPHYSFTLSHDGAGSVRRIVENYAGVLTDRTLTMKYDGAHRLIEEAVEKATGEVLTKFEYDNGNNRTKKSYKLGAQPAVVTEFDYSNSLNQLEGFTESTGRSVAYGYDLNGNRASRTEAGVTTDYSYDYLNRLVGVTKPAETFGYSYDYRTRRVQRRENETETNVVFSGGLSVREVEDGATKVEFVRGSDMGGGVGGLLYSLRNGSASYTHSNHRGDVISKTSVSGTETYGASYEAFGTVENQTGVTLDRQKHSTKEQDPTGLINMHQRPYDPEAGIFLVRDPAGFVDGPNLYAYVGGNPWSKFDPFGLADESTASERAGRVAGTVGIVGLNVLAWCCGPYVGAPVSAFTLGIGGATSYYERQAQYSMATNGDSLTAREHAYIIVCDLTGASNLYVLASGADPLTGQEYGGWDRMEAGLHLAVGLGTAGVAPRAVHAGVMLSTVKNITPRTAWVLASYTSRNGGAVTGRVVNGWSEVFPNLMNNLTLKETASGIWKTQNGVLKLSGDIDLNLYIKTMDRVALAKEINAKVGAEVIDSSLTHGVLPEFFLNPKGPNTGAVRAIEWARSGGMFVKPESNGALIYRKPLTMAPEMKIPGPIIFMLQPSRRDPTKGEVTVIRLPSED